MACRASPSPLPLGFWPCVHIRHFMIDPTMSLSNLGSWRNMPSIQLIPIEGAPLLRNMHVTTRFDSLKLIHLGWVWPALTAIVSAPRPTSGCHASIPQFKALPALYNAHSFLAALTMRAQGDIESGGHLREMRCASCKPPRRLAGQLLAPSREAVWLQVNRSCTYICMQNLGPPPHVWSCLCDFH